MVTSYRLSIALILKLIQVTWIKKGLMVSSFWKIVKQLDKQLIMNNLLKKSVHFIHWFYSSKKTQKKPKTFWQQFNKVSFDSLTNTYYHYAILDKLFEAIFTWIKYCRRMLFPVKKTKSMKRTGWSFITNKHVIGHLFQAVTL